MRYTTRPLVDRTWLQPQRRVSAPFRAGWEDTLKVLGKELDHLRARDVVLELDLTEGMIRNDGLPRADAKIETPAVALAFESKHGPLIYRCDRYVGRWYGSTDWHHNVRAIALTLEALRAVERYGATSTGQQYTGWKALGSTPFAPTVEAMTEDDAWARLADLIGVPVANARVDSRRTVDRAARAAHPDTGGSEQLWASYEAARKVLDL